MIKIFRDLLLACGLFAALSGLDAEDLKPDWPFPQGNFPPLFPFNLEKGAPENITNIQTWNGPWSDAGEGSIVSVRDGRLMKGEEPFRFVGTNLCFSANFCDHATAERLAETLARFGLRVVRLHHMDSRHIWGKNFGRTKTEIDPEQLERLDYLIAQLQKRGISVNINLHVSRGFDERDGFVNSSTFHNQSKGIDNFEPRMIELQKKYARDLLTHVNPYTGRAYTDDPGVAMIEINNENSLIALWYWGNIKKLGSPYAELFRNKWNEWLQSRFANNDELTKALDPTGEIALSVNVSLETGNLPVPLDRNDPLVKSEPFRREFLAFLTDLESKYWSEMYRFIKEELGAKSPVTGTQLQYGSWYAQAKTDYCDNHAYWHHPVFPHAAWDHRDWYVVNAAMVNSPTGGEPTRMSMNRLIGKAQTLSEYDHAYPILYGAEGNLTLAAVAAYQGWSGINHFAWSHSDSGLEPDVQTLFFDMCGNQAKMAHMPACYAILQRGDVKSGPGKYICVQDLTKADELRLMTEFESGWNPIQNRLLKDPTLAMVCWTGLRLVDDGLKTDLPAGSINVASWDDLPAPFGRPAEGEIRNEFGQLRWNRQDPEAGFFTVDTRGVKVFTGFVRGRSFEFDGLTLTPGITRLDWTTVSLTAINPPSDGEEGVLAPGRYLLVATGLIRNTDAVFKEYGEGKLTAAAEYGGSMGRVPVLCEGIPLSLELKNIAPERVRAYSLDEKGNRADGIVPQPTSTGALLRFGPEYKTLWYELTIEP
ncbi:MAG: cellulase family glycosylhydrolase [Thermoguttaceae bacterium]|jgi:hypothetical protein